MTRTMWGCLLLLVAAGAAAGRARLVCYVHGPAAALPSCTHLLYTGRARGDPLLSTLDSYRTYNPTAKIVLRVHGPGEDLRSLLKSSHVQGLELHDVHKALNRSKSLEAVEGARAALSSSGGGALFLSLPSHPELLAKYYDLRSLTKKVDLMVVETHHLGATPNTTYHPSRLSGLWDMMNTDSVVDLVVGLGVPASKLVVTLPASALQFQLQNETLSTPGSPTLGEPKEIGQAELCRLLQKGRWTLERDQDLSAPYAFKDVTWVSFEDASSVDVKGKYARVRGLAGLALHGAERDGDTPCGPALTASLAKVLNQQSRAPRAALLRSLEQDILSAPSRRGALEALQLSPYRITQVVDSDGVIHSIREDTRTEFSCSRQGYFVHPRSCARFYRCVKFDQLSDEYTVFEFDCPAGLSFDSRHQVCVWPGSLAHSLACPGSSEIAPVPRTRFICPQHEGYYADPENCRWFFACLDHGEGPLSAYEFRCPFGLGFDAARLQCEWPWLVPACAHLARYEAAAHGYSAAPLAGAAGFGSQTADAVNIAAHQGLASGAALDNLVGIQGGFLAQQDGLDSNFIASQELVNGAQYQGLSQDSLGFSHDVDFSQASGLVDVSQPSNTGFVQPTTYNDEKKYTSGSLILDDYRLPTKKANSALNGKSQRVAQGSVFGLNAYTTGQVESAGNYGPKTESNKGYLTSAYTGNLGQRNVFQSTADADNTGAYVHDPSGDYAEPYRHSDSPAVPYIHEKSDYKTSSDYYDYNRYKGNDYDVKYVDNSGQYIQDNSGAYVDSSAGYKSTSGASESSLEYKTTSNANRVNYFKKAGTDYGGKYIDVNLGQNVADNYNAYVDSSAIYKGSNGYKADYSEEYNKGNFGQYEGVYRADGHIGSGIKYTGNDNAQSYSQANAGNYISDSKAFTGSSHTLTAGAINVGLVGKTTLVDASYADQGQTLHPGHVAIISQPVVSVNHRGTDENNLDSYGYVTTPTSSGIPTTATPFAVTTALPAVTTYKTRFIPAAPKSTIKQVFGYSPPAVTFVQPTVVGVKQQYVTPKVEIADQQFAYQFGSKDYSSSQYNGELSLSYSGQTVKSNSSGYEYSKPSIKFEDGVSYTTAAPAVVSTYEPQNFAHSQQTLPKVESIGFEYSTSVPVVEEPFRKAFAYTTGPAVASFAQPTVSYTPQAFSHQTIHKVDAANVNLGATGYAGISYVAPKTVIHHTTSQPVLAVQPLVSTYQPQVSSQQTLHEVDSKRGDVFSQGSGYSYDKPAVKFEETAKTTLTYSKPAPSLVQYSTSAPSLLETYRPQAYSHQTLHKFQTKPLITVSSTPLPEIQYEYRLKPITVYQNPFLQYTQPKVTPVTYVQPTYKPQAFSQQTIHKIENNKAFSTKDIADEFSKTFAFQQPQTVVQYTTPQPIAVQPVVATYEPKVFSHQTLHKVEASQMKTHGAESAHSSPALVVSTYKPQAHAHQIIHKVENQKFVDTYDAEAGYQYSKPQIKFEESPETVFTYSTPAPVVSTYESQAHSQQIIHKVENQKFVDTYDAEAGYQYSKPQIKFEESPETVFTYSTPAPVVSTYESQAHSQQIIHKVENQKFVDTYDAEAGYQYSKPQIKFEESPETVFTYSTPAPVVSTYEPQAHSQQIIHKVEKQKFVDTYDAQAGYQYSKPQIKFKESPESVFTYSTPAPVISTYEPQAYRQQSIHSVQTQKILPVSATVTPKIDLTYQAASVSTYENPLIKYTQKVTPVTYVKPTATVSTQTYQPNVQQHEISHVKVDQYEDSQKFYKQNLQLNQEIYSYNQPEIQRNVETARKPYSDATVVSHQNFQLANIKNEFNSGNDVVFVSTTPATLAYEEHYSDISKIQYKAPVYIPPKNDYQQSYSVVSSVTPVVQKSFVQTQEQYIKPVEYQTVQKSAQQVSFTNSQISEPRMTESYHISSFPSSKVTSKFQQATYDKPEVQVEYKAEEYLPPVVSTPVFTTTYRPRTHSTTTREYIPSTISSTTREYLPPAEPEYAPKYLPPSLTYRSQAKSTTPVYKSEHLPSGEQGVNVVNFESFGFNHIEATGAPKIRYNPYEEVRQEVTPKSVYRKPNLVVETAKSNLLGFGTVGSDAGLVSPVTYTTAAPVVSSTYTYKPFVKLTTQTPVYVESTSYKAPEYLPPPEAELYVENFGVKSAQKSRGRYQETVGSTPAPVLRKQNIVVQTAKANQYSFNSDSDAGLVSQTYTASTPVVSSTESYAAAPQRVKSTYAPEKQGIFEVSPPPTPRTRIKPKVAVVTKINDFNPLLVRKLGAVCSCQSPVLVLRGKRPNVPVPQDFDDYTNEYEEPSRGDIGDDEWTQKSVRIQKPAITATPTTTVNPIIVPDDSYYQEYQPSNYEVAVTPKSQDVVSSTPVVSSTQRVVRYRPRVKAMTVAPTYKTVLLDKAVTPSSVDEAANHDAAASAFDSQSFDRYGPGGWRSRDETLQGSVDCKRAGLFRHPKQCNKFYACRWDCTKQRFTLHVFNCPVQLSFDPSLGACNWPSQGPACQGDTLLTNAL